MFITVIFLSFDFLLFRPPEHYSHCFDYSYMF
jgi:hypothetical protein